MIREADIEQLGIKKGGKLAYNLRYAGNIALCAESHEKAEWLIGKVNNLGKARLLKPNVKKAKFQKVWRYSPMQELQWMVNQFRSKWRNFSSISVHWNQLTAIVTMTSDLRLICKMHLAPCTMYPSLYLLYTCRPTSLGSHLDFVNPFNGIIGTYQYVPHKKNKLNSSMLKRRRFQSLPTDNSVRWKRREMVVMRISGTLLHTGNGPSLSCTCSFSFTRTSPLRYYEWFAALRATLPTAYMFLIKSVSLTLRSFEQFIRADPNVNLNSSAV